MKFFLVLLIVGVCNSMSYQDKSSNKADNGTREMKSMYLTKQADQIGQNRDDSSFFIQPSLSYQYPANDDDHLHQIVLSSLNSKIPDPNPISDSRASGPNTQAPTDKSNSFTQSRPPVYQTQDKQPVQSYGFKPSQYLGYRSTDKSKLSNRTVLQRQQKITTVNQNPRNNIADRRSDEDQPGENYVSGTDDSQYDSYGVPKPDYETAEPEYGVPKPEYGSPETRDGHDSFGLFPGSGPGFLGPAAFDPLPPPPAAIKGSVDYILIPLVLIGLAGPIFVVLYVILGALEYKLSPITSLRSFGDSYKPYIDTVMSSVSRALENKECLDYAACQVGSLCNQVGFTGDELMTKYVQPITPHKYQRQMRKLISSMKEGQECSIQKCLRFQ